MSLTPLQIAISLSNNNAVNLLLRSGADVNGINLNNETPLHTALIFENIEILSTLLRSGASVLRRNGVGFNAFHLAARSGNIEVFQLLMEQLSEIEANTPEAIRDIRLYSIHARSVRGITPLHLAVHHRHLDMIRYLVENGASLAERDEAFHSAIHYARTHEETLELLLSFGDIEVNSPDVNGITPLINAINENNINVVKMLLKMLGKSGENINFINKNNNIALNYALGSLNYEMINLLLENGADANHINNHGSLLLRVAAKKADESSVRSIIKLLLSYGAKLSSALIDGIQRIDLESVRALLKYVRGLNNIENLINQPDQNGVLPLNIAVQTGNMSFVLLLIQAGANPNVPDMHGRLTIEYAQEANNQNIIEIIETYRIIFNDENNPVITQNIENPEATRELINALRDIGLSNTIENLDMPDGDGNTPLHIATQVEAIDLIRMLLENGANPNISNREGNRPLSIARGNYDITQLLLEYGANDGIVPEDHIRSQAISNDDDRSEEEEIEDEESYNYSIGDEEVEDGESDDEEEDEDEDSRVIHLSDGKPLKKYDNNDEPDPSATGKDSSILNLIVNTGAASVINNANAEQEGKNSQGQANDSSDSVSQVFYNFAKDQAPLFTIVATSFVMYNYGSSFLSLESPLDTLLCGAVEAFANNNLIESYNLMIY